MGNGSFQVHYQPPPPPFKRLFEDRKFQTRIGTTQIAGKRICKDETKRMDLQADDTLALTEINFSFQKTPGTPL